MRTTNPRVWTRRTALPVVVLLLGGGLAACQRPTSSEPVRVGDFQVSARLVPDPPSTGDNQLVLQLRDTLGHAVDGASLDFLVSLPPWERWLR